MQGTYSARLPPVWLLRIVALESCPLIEAVRLVLNLFNTPPTDILIKRFRAFPSSSLCSAEECSVTDSSSEQLYCE